MPSPNVVDPKCPENYTLQTDRTKYRICQCIKNKKNKYDLVTVKKDKKRDKCPEGFRFNKKSGYCENKKSGRRSLMSVLFKDTPKTKTKRKEMKTKKQKKRPKCPDGYIIDHKLGLCVRHKKNKKQKTPRKRTVKRTRPSSSYYNRRTPSRSRSPPRYYYDQRRRERYVSPRRNFYDRERREQREQPKPRYNFRNTPNRTVKKTAKRQPAPKYISLGDYLKRKNKTVKKTAQKKKQL